jgi:hypothetical protein
MNIPTKSHWLSTAGCGSPICENMSLRRQYGFWLQYWRKSDGFLCNAFVHTSVCLLEAAVGVEHPEPEVKYSKSK